MRQDLDSDLAKDNLRDDWRRLIASEERLNFFKIMVGLNLSVREIEHLGDDLNNKFRSEIMRGGKSERMVLKSIMELKLKDERRFMHEIKERRERARKELKEMLGSKNSFNKVISKINSEAKRWRKLERSKYQSKVEHLKRIRKEEEIRKLQECPQEIIDYKDIIVFNKSEFDKMKKENVEISRIGNVELDRDEIAILKLPPKFAIRRKVKETEMQTELQMGMAKVRFQTHKRN